VFCRSELAALNTTRRDPSATQPIAPVQSQEEAGPHHNESAGADSDTTASVPSTGRKQPFGRTLRKTQKALIEMKLTFNHKLMDLRKLKDRLSQSIDATNRELIEIALTIGSRCQMT
jgi:hypothetical protein